MVCGDKMWQVHCNRFVQKQNSGVADSFTFFYLYKNGQMHAWESDFSICARLFPYLPTCPHISHVCFFIKQKHFQFSNECSSSDVTTLGKCGRKIPQLPAENFAGKLTFQLFQLDLQWCFCANNVGTSWGKRLQVQNGRPLWSGTVVAFCWSSWFFWSSRALELLWNFLIFNCSLRLAQALLAELEAARSELAAARSARAALTAWAPSHRLF